jgi:uncharacterized protein
MLKENLLPIQVDPFRFADNGTRLQGALPIKDMQRLGSSLSAHDGEALVQMEFGVDKQGIRFVRGQYTASLMLPCQRCLESFAYKIEGTFLSGIVHTEAEADQLPKNYDPLIAPEGLLILQDIIEDELIISLPIVPMHPMNDCNVKLPLAIGIDEPIEADKENPFKVIEFLKKRS